MISYYKENRPSKACLEQFELLSYDSAIFHYSISIMIIKLAQIMITGCSKLIVCQHYLVTDTLVSVWCVDLEGNVDNTTATDPTLDRTNTIASSRFLVGSC